MAKTIGNYVLEKEIGSGAFSVVCLAHHKISNMKVAVKCISKEALKEEENLKNLFDREVALLHRIEHQFVAEFYELVEDNEFFYLFMEYAPKGNMLDFLNDIGPLNESQARNLFAQLISILEYLHKQLHVAHRDLKPENILLDENYNIRLIDFGLSNVFKTDKPYLKTVCGSPAYVSPEMIQDEPYTTACDIWSAGVFLFSLVTGQLPFYDPNVQKLLQMIILTEPVIPIGLSRSLRTLIKRMLTKDPQRRISLVEIKESPWMKGLPDPEMTDQNYGISKNWRVVAPNFIPDPDIIQRVANYGLDVSNIPNKNETDPAFVLYKLLKKEKVTKEMKNLSLIKDVQKQPAAFEAPSEFDLDL